MDHPHPFQLAHGGFQIQIEQTKGALEAIGLKVDFLRWWEDWQECDLIHFFGRPPASYVHLAHQKGIKVVFTALHGSLGTRASWKRWTQKAVMRVAEACVPALLERLSWESYRLADACIVVTPWEGRLVHSMFNAPKEKIHVVPNGIEEAFLGGAAVARGPWLITTASILPVKRIVETAQAAVLAGIPYWVIGKPFAENDAYHQSFLDLCRMHPRALRYEGPVADRSRLAGIYREARGFALLSQWESLSISALEAAAGGCPLLLSDLPWAHSVFGDKAAYCPITSANRTALILRRFYDEAPRLQPPPKPKSWLEVAQQLKGIYETALKTSR